jgi:hypothetical protein
VTILREERDSCLIEADALDLQNGSHWKPWLRLSRRSGGISASHTFDRLMPVFGLEQDALRYAADLGRMLIDEGSIFTPISFNPSIITRRLRQPISQLHERSFAFDALGSFILK